MNSRLLSRWCIAFACASIGSWGVATSGAAAPNPIQPKGATGTGQITFEWAGDAGATQYLVRIQERDGQTVQAIKRNGKSFACADNQTCRYHFDVEPGDYQWQVRSFKDSRALAWSSLTYFTVDSGGSNGGDGGGGAGDGGSSKTLISPIGNQDNTDPSFEWKPFDNGSKYLLRVDLPDGTTKVAARRSARQFNCSPEVCRHSFGDLGAGDYKWRVRPFQGDRAGTWSETVAFSLASNGGSGGGSSDGGIEGLAPWRCQQPNADSVSVSTSSKLTSAIKTASCGSAIVLRDGQYKGSQTVTKKCSAEAPLLIRAANPQKARMTGLIRLRGEHICLAGLTFTGEDGRVRVGGKSNRVLGSRFSGWKKIAVEVVTGQNAEIAYNEFSKPADWLPPSGQTQARMGVVVSHDSSPSSVHRNGLILRNYFHDFPLKPIPSQYSSGQSDAVSICQFPIQASATGSLSSGWLIDSNLIVNHRGQHGLVDIKCSGVTLRNNTLLNSPKGRLDIRLGRDSAFLGNWIENAAGMLLHAGPHKILGNRLINAPAG
ncbi:MAG: chondroitinase-B domain-containing protein, partial [Pseudomonadota bacterium]